MPTQLSPALTPLIGTLALGQGFQVHVAICHDPRQVRPLLPPLCEAIRSRRGHPVRSEHLLPSELLPRTQALEGEALIRLVLNCLISLSNQVAGQELQLIVLDASGADADDLPAWRLLFQRLNGMYHALRDSLPAGLLLCLPPALEKAFIQDAPDFWGNRRTTVRLESAQGAPSQAPVIENLPPVQETPVDPPSPELLAARAELKACTQDPALRRKLMVLLGKRGDEQIQKGHSAEALKAYRECVILSTSLTRLDPANTRWQRDLFVSQIKMGNVLLGRGEPAEALKAFRASHGIAEALACQDPGNTLWQRDLSVSLDRLGDALQALEDNAGALEAFQERLGIVDGLAHLDPESTQLQRDQAVSCLKIGDLQLAAGHHREALGSFQRGVFITRALAHKEPHNLLCLRDLSVSYNKIGDMLLAQGDGPGASDAYQDALEIARGLAIRDPANAQWQVDVAVACSKLGAHAGLPLGERRTHLRQGRDILNTLRQSGRLQPGQNWIEWFDLLLTALPV
jgi:tetratricopeptide (TPR) repeat protein